MTEADHHVDPRDHPALGHARLRADAGFGGGYALQALRLGAISPARHAWADALSKLRIERVQDETRLRVQRLGDPILRERAHDFDDLARRLLRHLTGETVSDRSLPANTVLVARGMGPADM